MKTFGDTRIDLQLDEQRRSETTMHNEKVKTNLEILKRLIHCVIFLGKQELPFRGHDESRESANRDSGVKERFVKFEDVTGKKRAEDVAALALGFLEEHGCMDKLVAQYCDGAAVMASGLNGVQAK
ncbi:hypothetical protein NHX12_016881, partial [Muraenolepis orangiensis]